MTNTPDPSANPVLDELAEPSVDLRGKTADAANEMILQYNLGINAIPRNASADVMAYTIAGNIINRIDTTRHAISRTALSNLLQPNIDQALRRANARQTMGAVSNSITVEQERALEVTKAVMQSLDKRILDDMNRHATLNIKNPATFPNLQSYEIAMPNVSVTPPGAKTKKHTVFIDTRNTFWVEAGPFSDDDALSTALQSMRLEQVGIRIDGNPLLSHQTIPKDMADMIAKSRTVTVIERDQMPGNGTINRKAKLREIQEMLRINHGLRRVLADGSENSASAGFAASILMRYKDIASVLGGPGERTEVQTKLNAARAKRDLLKLIESPDQLQPTDVTYSWSDALLVPAQAGAARAVMGGGGALPAVGGEVYNMTGVTPRDIAAASAWIAEREVLARKNIAAYQRVAPMLQRILQMAFNAGVPAGALELQKLFIVVAGTPPTISGPDTAQFSPTINPPIAVMLDELKNHSSLNLAAADPTEDVKKFEQQLKDIDAGKRTTLTGDAAQHAVIAKYFEQYHHCSPTEATQAAQYMRSQMFLDKQTVTMTDQIADELVPEVRGRWKVAGDVIANTFKTGGFNFLGATDRDILIDIAYACGVRRLGKNFRDWEGASYPKLLTAYYTMQAFINKKEPAKVRLPSTQRVINEQKRIIAAITGKHASLLLRDFGAAQNITGEQAEAIKKDPTKPEHMQLILEMLEGDPPIGYKNRIDKAAGKVNDHHERGWRAAQTVVGTAWKPVKGGAVLGKQFVVEAASKGYHSASKTIESAKQTVKSNKGTLATFAIASLAGGPLVGGLAALAYKAVSGEKTNATSHATSH